jgi:hypothetical protein
MLAYRCRSFLLSTIRFLNPPPTSCDLHMFYIMMTFALCFTMCKAHGWGGHSQIARLDSTIALSYAPYFGNVIITLGLPHPTHKKPFLCFEPRLLLTIWNISKKFDKRLDFTSIILSNHLSNFFEIFQILRGLPPISLTWDF